MERVVEVDDQRRVRPAERGCVPEHVTLEHDDVDTCTEPLHVGTRRERAAEVGGLEITPARAQQLDVVVGREAPRHLPRRGLRGRPCGARARRPVTTATRWRVIDAIQPARLWASIGRSASPSHSPPSDTTPTSSYGSPASTSNRSTRSTWSYGVQRGEVVDRDGEVVAAGEQRGAAGSGTRRTRDLRGTRTARPGVTCVGPGDRDAFDVVERGPELHVAHGLGRVVVDAERDRVAGVRLGDDRAAPRRAARPARSAPHPIPSARTRSRRS